MTDTIGMNNLKMPVLKLLRSVVFEMITLNIVYLIFNNPSFHKIKLKFLKVLDSYWIFVRRHLYGDTAFRSDEHKTSKQEKD